MIQKAPPALAHGRAGLSYGPHYFEGVAAVAPLAFFGAFLAFFTGFLVLAVVVAVAACDALLLAAGLDGVARSQFHVAPKTLEAR